MPLCFAGPNDKTLLHFLVRRVFSAELAKLVSFQPIRIIFLIFHRRIISLLAGRASKVDDLPHRMLLFSSLSGLGQDFGDDAGAHGLATLAHGEA